MTDLETITKLLDKVNIPYESSFSEPNKIILYVITLSDDEPCFIFDAEGQLLGIE